MQAKINVENFVLCISKIVNYITPKVNRISCHRIDFEISPSKLALFHFY
jgi:hypothetical protein